MALIEAHKLTRIYQMGASKVIGLNQIDLEIAAGEMVVLKGESGSGKSTLLALLGGLDRPTRGTLVVAKQDLMRSDTAQLTRFRRKVVGIVFQTFNLLPTLNVLENICLPGLLAGKPYAKVAADADELVQWFKLEGRRRHVPSQLSGGEMQRTAIARALINDPAIILADEPTGNLDSGNGQMVIDLLADLNRRLKRTVIIATHSNLADRVASRQMVIKDGVIEGLV
jgi:putative ABC transport system ATP-binding protein